jgi:tetratricopeptide (TPR) repeat protein
LSNTEAHYERGLSLLKSRQYKQALVAFEAALALDPHYAVAHNSRGIALANLECPQEALASFNRALELNPDYAECHSNLGIVLQELGRLDEAIASFDRAIASKPSNARAYNNRGAALGEMRRYRDALLSYETATTLDPSYAEAFYNRGVVLHDLNRFNEALESFDEAVGLRSDYAEAHHNRGAVLQDMLSLDQAIAAYGTAIKLHPGRAESYVNQAYCYLQMGRLAEGWHLHEWRKKLPMPVGNRSFPKPLWVGGENLSGKTLFVHWEQGFGDTIQFCRYAKLLKSRGANVVMSVQEPLHRLLAQMAPEISIMHQNEVPACFDFHCPMMSLPLAFATGLSTIPAKPRYLSSDEALRLVWEPRLPGKAKPRVGIAWRGSATHKNDRNRSIDITELVPLLSAHCHWISLQYDSGRRHNGVGDDATLPPQLAPYGGLWTDFADAAAVLDCLDLVITVDTSVAHLAGALGKPVFILLPFNSDWRWLLDRDDSPWYPSARLFRQKRTESWRDVISRVGNASLEFLSSQFQSRS